MSMQLNFVSRLVAGLGAALVLSFAGCGAPEEGDGTYGAESVSCPASIATWTDGRAYAVGEIVAFNGRIFQCRQAHFSVKGAGWTPDVVAALFTPVTCGNGGGAVEQPPAQQPPAQQQPPVTQPPAQTPPPPAAQCNADGTPGPRFDPAGVKNVGNGRGLQFIGGQCLSAADCASGCCAKPCGICSGPGAQFQAGKQGCGFVR
jgi:hypothetical protein